MVKTTFENIKENGEKADKRYFAPKYNLPFKTFTKQAKIFTFLPYKSFENTVVKGEIARKEQFLLFPQCFLTIWGNFCHFHQIQNCRLQTFCLEESKICSLEKG